MGGSTTVQAPDASNTAAQALQAQVDISPQQYAATSQYAPKYSDLYSNIANSSLFGDANSQGLLSTYAAAAPQLQTIQNAANAQQAQGNVSLVSSLGPQAVAAYQAANPQLQQLQGTLTGLASTPQNPVGQNQFNNWSGNFNQQVGGALSQNQVAGGNPLLNQLNQTAQQQLALGGSVSPQQASQLSGQILANYNQAGRANDPTAIAGLATGLDTYSNQLLQQREANAQSAGSTLTNANQQAQIANMGGALSGLGLQAGATQSAEQQALQNQTANQGAQLANANYQSGLLTTAANLAQSSAVNPYQMILGQSGALSGASGAAGQAMGSANAGSQLANMYNPFTNGAFNTIYGGQLNANTATASNNAAITGATIGAVGSVAGGAVSAM